MTYDQDRTFARRAFWDILDYVAFCYGNNDYVTNSPWLGATMWLSAHENVSYEYGRHYAAHRESLGKPNVYLSPMKEVPLEISQDINGILEALGFGPEIPFSRV